MALYLVAPSADVNDPIVAASVARFRLMCPKPEAFAGMADAVIALHLEQHSDELQEALRDRIPNGGTVLQWDASCEGAVRGLTARSLMGTRGYDRTKGADNSIDRVGEEGAAYLERCRPGDPNGKRANPRIVTSEGRADADAPFVSASGRADSFIGLRARTFGGGEC